ncbi:hypothetical protein [Xylanimonas oleitrophica]|uniref:hypothetical protein n=1 Tax=Xylanimonas oleitrophica TaxID=2607479 RepID=UPI0015D02887|nr:hypothetical protein [Xylanimonas oleitrophica]
MTGAGPVVGPGPSLPAVRGRAGRLVPPGGPALWLHRLDARLVAPAPAWRARWVHALVAAVVGLRLATRDWTTIADRPAGLRVHANLVGWVPDLPAGGLLALQVLGIVAAVLAVARVWPRAAFAVAWACYLVLAGLWGSSGKVLHNDVLTVTVGFVLLFAAVPARSVPGGDRDVRWGWPPRAALAVLGVVYFLTGAQKLRHSGIEWALSDNMSWILREGTSPFGPGLTHAIADAPLLPQLLASGALLLELTAPVLLAVRWTRVPFALAVAAMHTSIWACLGLDYSAWVLTAAAVAVPAGLPMGLACRWRHRVLPGARRSHAPSGDGATASGSAGPPAP